ncbi:MAG: Resolvase-like protein [Parcubacteria group bacterium]|nr:Resolvase-like protein [Parcubacteria group bacterium]
MNRPAMKALLEYIDAHPNKRYVVVFDDLKRFARDVQFHLALRSTLRARNVLVECLNYKFDDSPHGKYVEVILAGHAELERDENRRQVMQKMSARLKAGYWPFGSKKGYEIKKVAGHGKLAVPKEPEATLLKTALEGFASGKFLRKIDACEYLVMEGFWKKQHPSKYIDRFATMLEDPFYAGYIEYLHEEWDVDRCKGQHEPIISMETFELNQKRLGKNGVTKTVRADASEDFSLRGLLICAHCGKHLTAAWHKGGKYPYYFCQNGYCTHKREYIQRDLVEESFRKLLGAQKMKPELRSLLEIVFEKVWYEEVETFEKAQRALHKERKDIEAKIAQLADSAAETANFAVRQAYEKRIQVFTKELEKLEEPVVKADTSIIYRTAFDKSVALLENPVVAWDNLNFLEKQQLFYFIFQEKIPYDKKEGYRTSNIRSTVRLFEEFVGTNSHDVEVGRLNSRARGYAERIYKA